MKMGTIASPWRYDAGAYSPFHSSALRRPAISCDARRPSGRTRNVLVRLADVVTSLAMHPLPRFARE